MKVCIAYESKYGNGKKCVEHLKSVIEKEGHKVDLSSIRDIKPRSIPTADLYVFSSPTHMGGPSGKMKKFLKKLELNKKGTKYALMTTLMDPEAKTLEKMVEILEDKAMTKVGSGLKIKVTGMKGPLEGGYEQKIEEFAEKIISV